MDFLKSVIFNILTIYQMIGVVLIIFNLSSLIVCFLKNETAKMMNCFFYIFVGFVAVCLKSLLWPLVSL